MTSLERLACRAEVTAVRLVTRVLNCSVFMINSGLLGGEGVGERVLMITSGSGVTAEGGVGMTGL